MKRAVFYMRVSTKNHGQTTDTQALALQEYATHRGFTIVEEYRDEGISGSKDSRPALDRLMKDARARKFDLIIVARFDRFARSVSHLLRALEEFSHLGRFRFVVRERRHVDSDGQNDIHSARGRGRTGAQSDQRARSNGHQPSEERGKAIG